MSVRRRPAGGEPRTMIDIAIRDGLLVDGLGGEPEHVDIGVEGERIVAVSDVGAARQNIDAAGLVVAPGFVDAHTHDDMQLRRDPHNREKVLQGVTTVVCGNCGYSAFPNRAGVRSPDLLGTDGAWDSFAGYAAALRDQGIGPNMGAFVGHNTVGRHLATDVLHRPDRRTRTAIADLVSRCVDEGALGVSTGLIYDPGRYSEFDDLVELAKAAADSGGIYSTHMRSEGTGLLAAIDESLEVARQAGAGVQLSHLKTIDPEQWGRIGVALTKIDDAHAAGIDVAFDVYPYTAGSGPFEQYFDRADLDVLRLDLVQIVRCPDFPDFAGLRVPEIAQRDGITTSDVARSIIAGPRATETICVIFEMDERDMRSVLAHPRAMIGSDGIPQDGGVPHPRLLGAFPRVLGQYSRDEGLFDLQSAVAKMSAIPASRYALADRGTLAVGSFADITIFNPLTVADSATYRQRGGPVGIEWVLINGSVAVGPDGLTDSLAGRVLTRTDR